MTPIDAAITAEIRTALRDKVLARDVLLSDPLPLIYIGEDEANEMRERVAFAARMAGLRGHALDEAMAAMFRVLASIVQRERARLDKRRATIKEVL